MGAKIVLGPKENFGQTFTSDRLRFKARQNFNRWFQERRIHYGIRIIELSTTFPLNGKRCYGRFLGSRVSKRRLSTFIKLMLWSYGEPVMAVGKKGITFYHSCYNLPCVTSVTKYIINSTFLCVNRFGSSLRASSISLNVCRINILGLICH